MDLKVVLLLLCNFYCVYGGEGTTTQSPAGKYPPCDNTIIFAYETTTALDEAVYKKQINFLTNYVFEAWSNYNGLTLFSDGNDAFKTDFKNKSDVEEYILNNKQVEKDINACDVFKKLYYERDSEEFTSFIIFLREFSKDDVDTLCNAIINNLNSGNNLLFVPLTNAVNTDDLKQYFPKSKILIWDEHDDTPDDWEEQFNKNFGCDRYPCNNNIFIGYETTTKLSAPRYQKQINFLANMLFESWTHFDDISLLSYGKNIFKTGFTSKSNLTEFISNDVQVKTSFETCDTFGHVNDHTRLSFIVLFLREFNQREVYDCKSDIDNLIRYSHSITFVSLTEDVIIGDLEAFFPQAKIIKWDIDSEDAPNDWENQFYDAYGCGNPRATTTATTHSIATTENPADCCQCSKEVFIAYDKSSNKLSKNEFKRLQNFLVDHVFKGWASFDKLHLVSYADINTHDEFEYFKTRKMLESFILNDKQVDKKPSLCGILKTLVWNYPIIIFTSEFTTEEITDDCKFSPTYLDANSPDFITIVAMTDSVEIDLISEYYPQVQIIKWNISGDDTPQNWEWQFTGAYNCKKRDKSKHPCDSKILVGYDESLNTSLLSEVQNFLTQSVFTPTWSVLNDLELIAYSEDMRVQGFGSMHNLNDIYDFINNGTETSSVPSTKKSVSLCRVFYALASTYTLGVNIVLFVSEFHEHESDECPLWIEKVRNNANSITFVNLTKNIDTSYLLSNIPHANFISWQILEQSLPDNLESQLFSSFGCENFSVESQTYPCSNKLLVSFDRSRYLSPISYQRLTNFLLTRVFINAWTNFVNYLTVVSEASEANSIDPDSLLQTKYFIHQSLKTEEEPNLCDVFQHLISHDYYLIFFVSKFNDEGLSDDCVKIFGEYPKQITFIKLGPLVNETYIMKIFPTALIISWEIEQEPELENWAQTLWTAFNCTDELPIVFPHSTSTVMPSTKSVTSTSKSSTILSSTKRSSTPPKTTLITSTATAPIPSSKSTTPGGNSKETILLAVFIPLLIIVILVFIACFCFYRRKQHQQLVENIASNNYYKMNGTQHEKREEDQWEISFDCLLINFLDKLGSGAFGDVYLGRINGPAPIKCIYSDSPHCQRFHDIDVAVKSLPSTQVDEYARSEFWKEIEFMKGLKFHPNLVCFLGYVYDPTSPLMLLEYCANGDLLKFIKTNKQKFVESFESQESPKTLTSFCWQISSGLEYLGSLDLIHRDIAARNILLDAQNVCKISDFGLCRNSTNQLYLSSGGKLPVKWMAIESLKENVFSTKTDVWSYGVLLYELFSLGQIPYAHVDNVLKYLDDGNRLEKPNYCSDDIYDLMTSCWLVDPDDRPTFTVTCQILSKMLETATLHYNYVDTLALIEEANQIETIESDKINL